MAIESTVGEVAIDATVGAMLLTRAIEATTYAELVRADRLNQELAPLLQTVLTHSPMLLNCTMSECVI